MASLPPSAMVCGSLVLYVLLCQSLVFDQYPSLFVLLIVLFVLFVLCRARSPPPSCTNERTYRCHKCSRAIRDPVPRAYALHATDHSV